MNKKKVRPYHLKSNLIQIKFSKKRIIIYKNIRFKELTCTTSKRNEERVSRMRGLAIETSNYMEET